MKLHNIGTQLKGIETKKIKLSGSKIIFLNPSTFGSYITF
jgi:hypothetical protein